MELPILHLIALTLLALIMGSFTVGTALVWWFTTSLPVHVFKLMRKLGMMKAKPWPEGDDYTYWMRHEWSEWSALNLDEPWGEGLNCPGCFSNATSLFTAAAYVALLGLPWWMALPLWTCYPSAGNLILSHVTGTNKD